MIAWQYAGPLFVQADWHRCCNNYKAQFTRTNFKTTINEEGAFKVNSNNEQNTSRSVGMWGLISIFIAYGVTLNTFSVGSAQAGHLPFWNGVLMIALGWAGLAIVGTITGNIGYEVGCGAPFAFRATFGLWGYKIPSILASIALIGFAAFDYWYVGQALINLFPGIGSAAFYIGILIIVLAAILGAIKDITSLKWLTSSTIPIALVLFFIIMFVTINRGGGMETLMNYQPPLQDTSLLLGANIMFSCWLSTVPGYMDFTRHAKTRKCVFWAIPLGMLVIGFQYFVGQLGTYAFGIVDFTSLSAALGGTMGLVCNLFTLFAQANTVPASTLMITSHLTASLKVPRLAVIIGQPLIAGALAIAMFLGADISIISSFGTIVGYIFAPLLAAIFAEYYVIGKRSFIEPEALPRFSSSGIITILVGFILGFVIAGFSAIQIPTAMLLLILCFVLHIFLRKVVHLK